MDCSFVPACSPLFGAGWDVAGPSGSVAFVAAFIGGFWAALSFDAPGDAPGGAPSGAAFALGPVSSIFSSAPGFCALEAGF